MQVQVWCKTDVGLRRNNNQDSYLIDNNLGLYIVADGMGGHLGGEVASTLAVETARDAIAKNQSQKSVSELIFEAYQEASRKIFERSQADSDLNGMGTTMVVVAVKDETVYIGNVGDSRAYLYQKPYLWQVTEDHSLVNEHLRSGLLQPDQARSFSGKNIITRSVGFEPRVNCDILEHQPHEEVYFLLCSDGLSGMVLDEKILEILNNSDPENVVSFCVEEAKKNGGDDNVTVMFIKVTPNTQ